jgi:hypothetical protein
VSKAISSASRDSDWNSVQTRGGVIREQPSTRAGQHQRRRGPGTEGQEELVVMTRNLMHRNEAMMLAPDRSVKFIYQNEFIDKTNDASSS